MISGSPRKKSTYAVARARSGKKTGPRSVRSSAISSPATRTTAPHTASSRRLSHSPVHDLAGRPPARSAR